jgi:hypothetical protein
MDAPHNYVYPPRDSEADQLVTTLILAGERLVEDFCSTQIVTNETKTAPLHATPRENPHPALFDDMETLSELVGMIEG